MEDLISTNSDKFKNASPCVRLSFDFIDIGKSVRASNQLTRSSIPNSDSTFSVVTSRDEVLSILRKGEALNALIVEFKGSDKLKIVAIHNMNIGINVGIICN